MEIENIIEFLKKETPEHEDLLNAAYEAICNLFKTEQKNIDNRISELLSERDYVKVNEYVQMSKKVSDIVSIVEAIGDKYGLYDNVEKIPSERKLMSDIEGKESSISNGKRINYEEFRVDENVPVNLMTDFRYMKPAAFSLDGVRYPARLWKLVFIKTCELLWEKNSTIFEDFTDDRFMQGKTRTYFSKDSLGMAKPELIHNTEIFVETNLSANNIRDVIIKMLEKYRIPTVAYQIYLSKDLTPLHTEEVEVPVEDELVVEGILDVCKMEKICLDYDVKTEKCLNENSPYFIMECCKQKNCTYIHRKKSAEYEPKDIYVLPKKMLKTQICPKCGEKMRRTMFLIGFEDKGEQKDSNAYGCLCEKCNTSYITEGTYTSFTRNKDLEKINVNFYIQENGQLSLF